LVSWFFQAITMQNRRRSFIGIASIVEHETG